MELSSALRREQKAQLLLQEQSNQLMELTSRLDVCASDGVHKENNLVQVQEVSFMLNYEMISNIKIGKYSNWRIQGYRSSIPLWKGTLIAI